MMHLTAMRERHLSSYEVVKTNLREIAAKFGMSDQVESLLDIETMPRVHQDPALREMYTMESIAEATAAIVDQLAHFEIDVPEPPAPKRTRR